MPRIFSGIQPTGIPHIGNYLGALKTWVELQKDNECIYCVVDLHAITSPYEPKTFSQETLKTAALLIAVGIDPDKSALFIQSHRPEVTELAWIFNTLATMGELSRMTQYKEKTEQFKDKSNVGLFTYPLLQVADILIYNADRVPVGEDQVQHVEITRAIARRFNSRFGQTFPEPEPILTNAKRIMSLQDPAKKMSKSIPGSYIGLLDSPEEIKTKIQRAVTDSGPQGKEMGPAVANLFTLLEAFADSDTLKRFQNDYQSGTIRYTKLKEALSEAVIAHLAPIQQKYNEIISKPEELKKVLIDGAARLAPEAAATLNLVKKQMGFLA